jgi:CRISPR-associated protein Cas2
MTVLIVKLVSPSLRGELSRWMLQVAPGVFIGRLALPVRDRIWERACAKTGYGSVYMFEANDSEQGYRVRVWCPRTYTPEDFDGITLICERAR